VNGQNVGLDIYTSLNPLSSTKKVLLFVFGGGFFNLWRTGNQAEVAELQGVGQAFFQDAKASGVNMLTVVPRYEYYSPPPNLYSPPPDGATPAAYEAPLDIGCTIAWIRKYSHAYGGSENPDITLVGYSSGAGVVASVMLAANQFIPSPEGTLSDVTGVLTMSGNYDYKKAEDSGQVPYFEWYHIRGEPTSTPETSPLQQGSPSPASTLSVPWIIEYEQCDADEHYADAQRLSAALNGGWNNYPTYVYENTQHYTYSGYPYEPTPTPGPATHGDGQFALALYGSPLHNLLLSMINGVTPTPNPIPTWEAVPLPNIGGVPEGVQDVAVGDDGTMWVVTTATASPTLGQYYKVAKYSDPANGANNCLTNPVTDPGAAQRIAVDGYGDPWTVSGTPGPGTVSRLPGGLIAAAPTYSPGCVGCVGTASSFTPLPNATATDVGAGGGTLSGTAAPEVYRRFSRSIGSVWIASTTPSSDSPDDFLLEHWAGTGWSTSPAGIYGQQLAVDANGKPWVVIHDGTIWSTESLSGCSPTANFCEAPGIASVDVGAGGTVTWGIQSGSGAPPSPLPGLYSYSNSLVVPTWVRLAPTPPPPFVAAARITVTMDGFPVIADTTNDLWIYHPCTWPDGSPGGGNAAICSL
jgi:hypothetical protein